MPRGVTTLEQMVKDLRLETRRSPNTSIGQDEQETLKRLLARTQYWLYWNFDWPHMKVRRDIRLSATQRYYDAPSTMDFERIVTVSANGSGRWEPISRGITMDDYNTYNSDNNEQSDLVQKWDILDTGSREQIEVWPIPASDGETLRLEGHRKLGPLVSDNDVCTLDDTLIVLTAAVELLTGEDDKKAERLNQRLNAMYLRMRGTAVMPSGGFFRMGVKQSPHDPHNRPTVIAPQVGGSGSSGGGSSSSGGSFSSGFSSGFG